MSSWTSTYYCNIGSNLPKIILTIIMTENEFREKTEADEITHRKKESRRKGAIFLGCMGGLSVVFGFGATVAMSKRKDPAAFGQGLMPGKGGMESGASLAMKALGWGTVYAVSGFGLFCYAVWKLMGVHSMDEFTAKVQKNMPVIPKHEPQGRSEFKTIRELFEYIIEEDEKAKSKGDKKS